MCAQARVEPTNHESLITLYETKYREQLSLPSEDRVLMTASLAKQMRDFRDNDGNVNLRKHPDLKDRALRVFETNIFGEIGIFTDLGSFLDICLYTVKSVNKGTQLHVDLFKLIVAYNNENDEFRKKAWSINNISSRFDDLASLLDKLTKNCSILIKDYKTLKIEVVNEKSEIQEVKENEEISREKVSLEKKVKELKEECTSDFDATFALISNLSKSLIRIELFPIVVQTNSLLNAYKNSVESLQREISKINL